MDFFNLKDSRSWDDSTDSKQLHSNLFQAPASPKKLKKGKKKPHPRDARTKPGKLVVLQDQMEDVTTKVAAKSNPALFEVAQDQADPPPKHTKRKRTRTNSQGSVGSMDHFGADSKLTPERTRTISQGSNGSVDNFGSSKLPFGQQKRIRTNSQGSVDSVQLSKSKLGKHERVRTNSQGSVDHLQVVKHNRVRTHSHGSVGSVDDVAQRDIKQLYHRHKHADEDVDSGDVQEPKKRKRKAKKNKFKDAEGHLKEAFRKADGGGGGVSNQEPDPSSGAKTTTPLNGSSVAKSGGRNFTAVKPKPTNSSKQTGKHSNAPQTAAIKAPNKKSKKQNKQVSAPNDNDEPKTVVPQKNVSIVQKSRDNTADDRKQKTSAPSPNISTKQGKKKEKKLKNDAKTVAPQKIDSTVQKNRTDTDNVKKQKVSDTSPIGIPSAKKVKTEKAKKGVEPPINGHGDRAAEGVGGKKKRRRQRLPKNKRRKGVDGETIQSATSEKVEKTSSRGKGRKRQNSETASVDDPDDYERSLEDVKGSEGLFQKVTVTKKKKPKRKRGHGVNHGDEEDVDKADTAEEESPQPRRSGREKKTKTSMDHHQEDNDDDAKKSKEPAKNMRSRLETQLMGSHFRFLNEKFYLCSGDEAFTMMREDRDAFKIYHEGYSQQVQQWPVNPVDVMIDFLKSKPANLVVGDFGCGEAKIAQTVKQKVHSFDLSALNKHVKVCDMTKIPLSDNSLDVAVYCLSLMGTNWISYLKEANRLLKPEGILKIAEVASRFQSLAGFVKIMKSLGFQSTKKDLENTMFYMFDFVKRKPARHIEESKGEVLKPCLYKKR